MTRNILAILLTIFALASFVPTNTANAADPIELHGLIAGVGDHAIALHTRRGDVRIGVVERTEITINGEPARLHSLQRGDRALVVAQWRRTREGRRLVALSIAVRRDRR